MRTLFQRNWWILCSSQQRKRLREDFMVACSSSQRKGGVALISALWWQHRTWRIRSFPHTKYFCSILTRSQTFSHSIARELRQSWWKKNPTVKFVRSCQQQSSRWWIKVCLLEVDKKFAKTDNRYSTVLFQATYVGVGQSFIQAKMQSKPLRLLFIFFFLLSFGA